MLWTFLDSSDIKLARPITKWNVQGMTKKNINEFFENCYKKNLKDLLKKLKGYSFQ